MILTDNDLPAKKEFSVTVVGSSEGGRFSFRLNEEEMERVDVAMRQVASRYPPNIKITQKLLFLEGLSAIDWREHEKLRKRKPASKASPRKKTPIVVEGFPGPLPS